MRTQQRVVLALACAVLVMFPVSAQEPAPARPLRLAIAGLVHGHVSGFLRAAQARPDVQIVAVFERDTALLDSYGDRYKLPPEVRFTDLAAMMERAKPEAIASFTIPSAFESSSS